MKVKLTDQLHISEVSPDTLPGGSEINVSDSTAKSLIDRGLATKMGSAPKNKARQASANKGRRG
jgi:hypothetical protein